VRSDLLGKGEHSRLKPAATRRRPSERREAKEEYRRAVDRAFSETSGANAVVPTNAVRMRYEYDKTAGCYFAYKSTVHIEITSWLLET
jgi:hypothetical protein